MAGRPQPPYQPPARASGSGGNRTLMWVLIVVGVVMALGIGGCTACVALVGTTANEGVKAVNKELERQQNRNAITDEQASQLEVGVTKDRVLDRFGPPAGPANVGGDRRTDFCLYYNRRGGDVGDQWELCFDGVAPAAKLERKRRV